MCKNLRTPSCFLLIRLGTIVSFLLIEFAISAHMDNFEGTKLKDMWNYRDPANMGQYRLENGNLVIDLKPNAVMGAQGTDCGVMFLVSPPPLDSFTVEMKVNVAVEGEQPAGNELGIVFFNESKWAFSYWRVYMTGAWLLDCVGANERDYDYPPGGGTNIGVEIDDAAHDQDIYIKVVKTGTVLEFFAKGNIAEEWISGGVDTKLGPYYKFGDYKIGILARSWGGHWFGSECHTLEVDYFDVLEISTNDMSSIAIKPEYRQVPLGSKCAEEVSLHYVENLHSFQFDVHFDSSVLQAESVSEGGFLNNNGAEPTTWSPGVIDNVAGTITGIFCRRNNDTGVSGDATLAIIQFRAINPGVSQLEIKNIEFKHPDSSPIYVLPPPVGEVDVWSQDSIFYLSFDNESVIADRALGNPNPVEPMTSYQFTDGIKGKAISVPNVEGSDYHLAYEEDGNLNVRRGTVMFWVRPKWNPENAEEWNSSPDFPRSTSMRIFFCNATPDPKEWSNGSIMIGTKGGGYGSELEFIVRELQPNQPPDEGRSFWKPCDISYWNKEEWHHVAYAWDAKVGVRIYIDGAYWRWGFGDEFYGNFTWNPTPWGVIRVGCHMYGYGGGWGLASADIDELYIYDRMLSEEEIAGYYREIMPVEVSAEDTILSNTQLESFVSLEITNRTNRTVTGELEWRFYNTSGTESITLLGNEKKRFSAIIPTPAKSGRHYLNCLWKGDMSFSRVIRLLVIDGTPRPSQDILTLSSPIETIYCFQDYPSDRYCDTGDAEVVSTPIGQYRQTGTSKYSAFCYNFSIKEIDKPHLLVVEYPDDAERTMEIVLNAPKYRMDYDVQIGIFTGGGDYPPTNRFNRQKIIFWPRYENYSISIRNLWEGHRAAARRITLYVVEGSETEGWLPANKVILPEEEPVRLLGLWWEDARIGELFGGKGMAIEEGNPMDEFYRNLKNMIDYLHYTGHNLIVYPIYMYTGPHYPSDKEEYLSHFRRFYHPDDWVELILRMCEINDIYFIPSISMLEMNSLNEISATNSEINQVDKFGRVVEETDPYPIFNPLHPLVQEKILALVDEILNKYGHFNSFKGISFYFWANTILWFGSLDCSYDDYTWSLFVSENQGVPNFTGFDRFSKRYNWVMDKNDPNKKELWVNWRCGKIREFLLEINDKLRTRRDDLKLIISGWLPYPFEYLLEPVGLKQWDGDPNWMYRVYREGGLDIEELGKIDGIVVEQVIRVSAYRERTASGETPESAKKTREVLYEPTYYSPFAGQKVGGVIIYNGYFESGGHIPKYPDTWGEEWKNKEVGWIASAITPGGKYFMENYMLVMSNLEPFHIGNGGLIVGTIGHEDQIRSFAKAYLSLPAKGFSEITHPYKDNFQVRELTTAEKHYFYIVNKKPDAVGIKLTFSEEVCITDIAEETTKYGIREEIISLDGYELKSYFFTPPRAQISGVAIVSTLLYSKELASGWELISIPVQTTSNSLNDVLHSISDSFISVWHYDSNSKSWKKYIKNAPLGFNDLDTIEPKKGYWVNMAKVDTLEIIGTQITNTAVSLSTGWNLVGYPSLESELVNEALLSISQQYISVWTYYSDDWYRHIKGTKTGFNNLERMEPWRGYWIKVSNDCIWDINAGPLSPPFFDFKVEEPYVLSDVPKVPYILCGNIEIKGKKIPYTNAPLVFLKSGTGNIYSSCQIQEKGFYMLEAPTEIGGLELYVQVDGVEVKVSPAPTGKMGEMIWHDISLDLTPKESKLYQNYPNPFNSETWIPYQLAEDAKVTIKIYNSNGQLIKILDLGYRRAGSYTTRESAIYWDGMTDSGECLASGIYFYSIQIGNYNAVKKMIIIR